MKEKCSFNFHKNVGGKFLPYNFFANFRKSFENIIFIMRMNENIFQVVLALFANFEDKYS